MLFIPVTGSPQLSKTLRLISLAVLICTGMGTAHADDFADVNQLVRAGKLGEALTRADQFLATKPRDAQMRFLKGVIQTESAKPQDAIATFSKLTEDFPELPEPYNNLAVLYAGQSQFDKARAALEMAIRTNPSYATAHENLGDVYAKLASQAYGKALQLDGTNAGVQPKLGLIRSIFTPDAKGQKPSTTPTAAATTLAPAKTATPVAPAATVAPAAAAPVTAPNPGPTPATPAGGTNPEAKDVEAAVRAWAASWSAKDMGTYLGAYGKEFDPPGSQARKAWEEDRRARITGKSRINVSLSNVAVSFNGSKATARFKQDYSADSLKISSRKTLELVRAGDRWVIVRESTGG
jgi:tetratricopeptide (TPR) repeat protein